jgi:NAD(P)-dependent dehydrogenase (short-subunit alcohol dehydrogenase family)
LAGRVAVITGGASGIGYGTAEALAEAGMRLVLADIDSESLALAAAKLRASGVEVVECATDVRDAGSVDSLARTAIAKFGAVHVVCNNAGVWTLSYQWETGLDDWQWVIDVNLWGVIHGLRTFVPLLLANADGGHVVNTASMGGLTAGPLAGPYAASKGAVVALSKGLAAELAMRDANVGVTVVCPGKVDTPILGRFNQRPGAASNAPLPADVQAVADLLTAPGGLPPKAAGQMIRDAIISNRFWVFPGAEAHRPLLERESNELFAAFPGSERSGS